MERGAAAALDERVDGGRVDRLGVIELDGEQGGTQRRPGGTRREISILFAHIRGYSTWSEDAPAVAALLAAYSIGLGTHAENAKYLAYGLPTNDLRKDAIPSGISCRFCERTDCNQRAAASYRFAFSVDEYTKKDCFFSPLLVHEQGNKGVEP